METFPDEPVIGTLWEKDDFDSLIAWCNQKGASDISLVPEKKAFSRIHGKWCSVTKGKILKASIEMFAQQSSNNMGVVAVISSGEDYDYSYELMLDRETKIRLRANATGCYTNMGDGINLIFRFIPEQIPSVEDLGLEESLLEGIFPDAGLCLVAGTMGSGKSTLLAAIMREIRINQSHRSVVTYESPIEFNLTDIPEAEGCILQTEVPRNLNGFHRAPENAARRAVDVMLIGESRELETFKGVCESAEIGTATYTTVHTQSVAETVRRIINKFPAEQRNYMYASLVSSLRMIVYQTLVPKKGGGRVAVREWLSISKEFRSKLLDASPEKADLLFREEIYKNGQALIPYAENLLKDDLITQNELQKIIKKYDVA